MEKQHTTFIAKGEVSIFEADIINRYLGRWGLSNEVSVDGIAEREPSLGYMTYSELHQFYASENGLGQKDKLDRRLWNILVRESDASKTPLSSRTDFELERHGKYAVGDELLEVFKIGPDAEDNARIDSSTGQTAWGYELNIDTVETLIKNGQLRRMRLSGPTTLELAQAVVNHRREAVEHDG